jgi:uncharacterized protein
VKAIVTSLILIACGTIFELPRALAEEATAVTHHTAWARMRDGVLLASEVYLPKDAQGRLPVVLMRSPYNNGDAPEAGEGLAQLLARGYVVVNQDCRGTGRSQGVYRPFEPEQNDGYDAVEWAAVQPWSNGKVGLWGGSYLGVTVMQAVAAHPPHLVAAVAIVTASDYHDNWTYDNGVFDLWFNLSWVSGADIDAYRRQLLRTGVPWAQVQERLKEREANSKQELSNWLKQIPLDDFAAYKVTAPFYYQWLAHPTYGRYWSKVDLERRYGDVKVPVMLIGGWYDIFSVGTVRNFLGLKSRGGSSRTRKQTKLLMEPICHGNCNETLTFGTDVATVLSSMNPRWWDYWLKGIDNGVKDDPAVKLFVMIPPGDGDKGGGYWTVGSEYPLPGTKLTRLFLTSRGNANTRLGDGVLSLERPTKDAPDRFIYDPHNPVPTRGGNLAGCDLFKPGVFDQSEVELRNDILVYTGEPLSRDLTIIGPVAVEFWAASTAPDTDFTAKLVAVRPDGVAYNILDRIVNAQQRRGSKLLPESAVPGRAYRYRLDLGDTAIVLRSGFRVRLEISSSNFPHFARNPNTGRPRASERELQQATQTITHDARHSSYLELPIVP